MQGKLRLILMLLLWTQAIEAFASEPVEGYAVLDRRCELIKSQTEARSALLCSEGIVEIGFREMKLEKGLPWNEFWDFISKEREIQPRRSGLYPRFLEALEDVSQHGKVNERPLTAEQIAVLDPSNFQVGSAGFLGVFQTQYFDPSRYSGWNLPSLGGRRDQPHDELTVFVFSDNSLRVAVVYWSGSSFNKAFPMRAFEVFYWG